MQEITFQQNSFYKEEIFIFKNQPTWIYDIINKILEQNMMPVILIVIELFWVKNISWPLPWQSGGSIMCTCLFYLIEVKSKVFVSEGLITNETSSGRLRVLKNPITRHVILAQCLQQEECHI